MLKVTVPCSTELWTKSVNIFFRRSELARGIHSIGPQQLISIFDGLCYVNAAIGEGVDSIPLVQIGTVSVERQVMILVVMPNAVKLFYEWDTGFLKISF